MYEGSVVEPVKFVGVNYDRCRFDFQLVWFAEMGEMCC